MSEIIEPVTRTQLVGLVAQRGVNVSADQAAAVIDALSGAIWSDRSVGSGETRVQLTWQQAHDVQRDDAARQSRWASTLFDLNRCEHGRHEGDICGGGGGCNGPSKGNPVLAIVDRAAGDPRLMARFGSGPGNGPGRLIGFDISANPIVVPERERMQDPSAWKVTEP